MNEQTDNNPTRTTINWTKILVPAAIGIIVIALIYNGSATADTLFRMGLALALIYASSKFVPNLG